MWDPGGKTRKGGAPLRLIGSPFSQQERRNYQFICVRIAKKQFLQGGGFTLSIHFAIGKMIPTAVNTLLEERFYLSLINF